MLIAFFQCGIRRSRFCQRRTVIRPARILRCNRHRFPQDRQGSGIGHDVFIVTGSICSVSRDRIRVGVVIACIITYVCDTGCCCRDRERISIRKCKYLAGTVCSYGFLVIRDRIRLVLMQLAVIRPFLRRRSDLKLGGILCDRQRSVRRCDQVVADFCCCSRCHRHAVHCRDHVRLCAHIRDRTVFGHHDREGMGIACLQLACCEVAFCQGLAVIRFIGIFCRDRYSFRIDLQRPVRRRYQVVADCCRRPGRYRYAVHCRDHVRLCSHVRDRAVFCHNDRKGMIIAFFQRCCCELRLRQGTSVIRPARVLRCDRYSLRRDRQRPRHRRTDAIVPGDILAFTICYNNLAKFSISISANIFPAGRCVCNRQCMSFSKSCNGVVICCDRFTRACNITANSIAILFTAIISCRFVIYDY